MESRRRSNPAIVVTVIALVWTMAFVIAPSAAHAGLAGTKPNIVLIITDDQSLEAIQYMPYVKSQLDANKYINFTSAETNNPLCCPARASIFTGQVDTRTGVLDNGDAARFRASETFAVPLHNAGYRTGLFGKALNGYNGTVWPGWDDFQALVGQNMYSQYNYTLSENGALLTHGSEPADYLGDVIRDRALQFITDTPSTKPLMLYVAPTSTHSPYVAPPRYQNFYSSATFTLPASWNEADVSDKPAWVQQLPLVKKGGSVGQRRQQYAAGMPVDEMIQAIDAELAATGRLNNTVEIILSDNGLSQGLHRWPSKICELGSCQSVPMLVRYPGQAGRTDTRLVSNTDIAPTLAALAGTSLQAPADGINLVPILENRSGTIPGRSGILQHWPGGNDHGLYPINGAPTPGFYGYRTAGWRYVEVTNLAVQGNTEYELYDQINDPMELVNQANNPAFSRTRSDMQAAMYAAIRATGATPGVPVGQWQPR